MKHSAKLDRRVAVITGAGAGIGEAAARLFAREGARLVVVDIDPRALATIVAELEAASVIVLDLAGDVSQGDFCKTVIARTMAQFGRLDILFNNAGIVFNGNLVECTEEEWDKTLDVNLKSMYLLSRSAVPVMQRQGGGSIINMASVAGPTGVANRGAYSVSKAGVIGFTKSLAMEFAGSGITVNNVPPGFVNTEGLQESPVDVEGFAQRTPMKRPGRPENIAAAVAFLVSEDADYITGHTLSVNGGRYLN